MPMVRVVSWVMIVLLSSLAVGCDQSDTFVSMTMRQRSTQTIPGLGLNGQVRIRIGDIRSSDVIQRTTEIDDLEVIDSADQIIALANDLEWRDTVFFEYEGSTFLITVSEFDTSVVFEDEVELTVEKR